MRKTARFAVAVIAALSFMPAWAGDPRDETSAAPSAASGAEDGTARPVAPQEAAPDQPDERQRVDEGSGGGSDERDAQEQRRREREQELLNEIWTQP